MTRTMQRTMRVVFGAMLTAALVVGGSSATMASEPGNNTFTFNSSQLAGDYELLAGTNSGLIAGINIGSINSTSDVDYMVVTCANHFLPKIDDIRLGGVPLGGNLPGDFDIYVYDPDSGNQIGSGVLGGTSSETVNISALNRGTVVVKVVYYTGSIGQYQVRVDCH
jgi:hypothetical protein